MTPARYINPKVHLLFTPVPDWLMCRPELSPGAKLCYSRLARWYGANPALPDVASVPTEALGRELAVSGRQVFTYLRELERVGLVVSQRRGQGQPNAYHFPDHPWRSESAAPPPAPASDQDEKETSGLSRERGSRQERKHSSRQDQKNTSVPAGRILPTKREAVKKQDQREGGETRGASALPPPSRETPSIKVEGTQQPTTNGHGAEGAALAVAWVGRTGGRTLNAVQRAAGMSLAADYRTAGKADQFYAVMDEAAMKGWSYGGFLDCARDRLAGTARATRGRTAAGAAVTSLRPLMAIPTDAEVEAERQEAEAWMAEQAALHKAMMARDAELRSLAATEAHARTPARRAS